MGGERKDGGLVGKWFPILEMFVTSSKHSNVRWALYQSSIRNALRRKKKKAQQSDLFQLLESSLRSRLVELPESVTSGKV